MSGLIIPGSIDGWENEGGVLCPVQPSTPEPKMYSYICRNCGGETVSEEESGLSGLIPFDLGCAHCAEYALEFNGEKIPGEEEG